MCACSRDSQTLLRKIFLSTSVVGCAVVVETGSSPCCRYYKSKPGKPCLASLPRKVRCIGIVMEWNGIYSSNGTKFRRHAACPDYNSITTKRKDSCHMIARFIDRLSNKKFSHSNSCHAGLLYIWTIVPPPSPGNNMYNMNGLLLEKVLHYKCHNET